MEHDAEQGVEQDVEQGVEQDVEQDVEHDVEQDVKEDVKGHEIRVRHHDDAGQSVSAIKEAQRSVRAPLSRSRKPARGSTTPQHA